MKEQRAMKTRPRLRDHNDNKNAVGQEGKQGSCFAVPDATLLLLSGGPVIKLSIAVFQRAHKQACPRFAPL